MAVIKEKIRQTKMGDKNPNHKKVKQTDLETGEIIIFGSLMECARFHNVKSKAFIVRRCAGEITEPYRHKYLFEFYNE